MALVWVLMLESGVEQLGEPADSCPALIDRVSYPRVGVTFLFVDFGSDDTYDVSKRNVEFRPCFKHVARFFSAEF